MIVMYSLVVHLIHEKSLVLADFICLGMKVTYNEDDYHTGTALSQRFLKLIF